MIRAHKIVLASASPIFRDMFQYDENYIEYQVVHMKMKSRFTAAVIDIVYMGETQVKEQECEEFMDMLQCYKLFNFQSYREEEKRSRYCYYNGGFCKAGRSCLYTHYNEDCEIHMSGNH